jgi:hypothetical protein
MSSIQVAIVIPVQYKVNKKILCQVAIHTKGTATENPLPRQDFCC